MAYGWRCAIAGIAAAEVTDLKAFAARSEWLAEESLRLDATAYVTGGLQARDKILARGGDWKPLGKVARLFSGPRFTRRYVLDRERGTPFLSSSDILLTDLSGTPFLSNKGTPELPKLLVESGWTLISCSGTIGNTAYVRGEMIGMGASQHVMRAAPHESEIKPGFLFAYLTSKGAQAMIAQRTYGSVIQHIEPHHIADLPVPLPDETLGGRIHSLVESAACKRTEAARLLTEATAYFDALAGPMTLRHEHARAIGVVRAKDLSGRLDAFNHIGWTSEPQFEGEDRVDDLADVFATNRVPRIYAKRGIPFVSGIDVFQFRPRIRELLAIFVADQFDARLKTGELLVQGSGQRYGLLGRAAYVGRRMDGWAASHDLFRIRSTNKESIARIFVFLNSESGHRSMLRHSYGTSIPHVNPRGIAALNVPILPQNFVEGATRALELREEADAEEESAIQEVEAWLS